MSAIILKDLLVTNTESKPMTVVVRVKTSCWRTKRGLSVTKQIQFLRRNSSREGVQFIEEDASSTSADMVIDRIINLNRVKDGIYRMIWINEYRDCESGHLEDWDYELVAHEEAKL